MARFERFTFLVDKEERQLITTLAERLQRSQSDAVRYLIAGAIQEFQAQDTAHKSTPQPANKRKPIFNPL